MQSRWNPASIINAACMIQGISTEQLLGEGRERPVVTARRMAMVMMRDQLHYSSVKIGRILGRHHATVLHNMEVHDNQYKIYAAYADQYDSLTGNPRTPIDDKGRYAIPVS